MQTIYIFIPHNDKSSDFAASPSLRRLCNEFGLPYASADYRLNRAKKGANEFIGVSGKVIKIQYLTAEPRGKEFGGF